LRKVTNLNAALKLEINAVSIFSDQYRMFDLTWIASDELITLNNTETESYSAEKLSSNFGNNSGHNICLDICMHVCMHVWKIGNCEQFSVCIMERP
jgi:hypothetical protein